MEPKAIPWGEKFSKYMFKKFKNFNGGEMSFAMEFLLLIVALFVIWMFLGGAKGGGNVNEPFMKEQSIMNTQ